MPRKKAPIGSLLKRGLRRTFIQHWREHRGLTLEQLAPRVEEFLGTSFSVSTLSRIENAKSPYSQRQLEALSDALACTPADLLIRNPLDKDTAWAELHALKPDDRRRAAEFIRALAETSSKTGTHG